MEHTEAYTVYQQIYEAITNGESFNQDSKYTVKGESVLAGVLSKQLFHDLSENERMELADKTNVFPTLEVWDSVYIKVYDTWVLVSQYNTWDSRLSYYPRFVKFTSKNVNYVLEVETLTVFRQV